MKKNTAGQFIGAQLNSRTDGSPVTSGSTSVFISGDGGPQVPGSGSPSCIHLGNGFWSYEPTQAETDYSYIAFTFVNSNAVVATVQLFTAEEVWDVLLAGGLSAADLMRVQAAVAAGKTRITDHGGGNASVVFRDVTDSSDAVSAEMTGSTRSSVVITP